MTACRCVGHVSQPRAIRDPHEAGCPLATQRCAGCGHALSRHRTYANGGRNRHGATLVCTGDNCAWTECRDPRPQEERP
jgi:hypothetical protein